ncbi:MAG: SUMF1/EgtB/PvdO family nonheme iron enzyme, partial [Verrucomicrobia bacterium]|nr:SUMF1/EgtB/PvdO family nonheme iron enzyme [Verrucomicrobiota bacterium]
MVYTRIPAGSYQRGNVIGDVDITDAPVQTVTLSEYYMQTTETTKSQWDLVRNWASTQGYTDLAVGAGKADNHPVQMMTWYDTVKWCNAASEMEGLTPCYYTNNAQTLVYRSGQLNLTNLMVNWGANGYRLPTEAEWEVASRGGLYGKRFPWGDTIQNGPAASGGQANYRSNTTADVYDLGPNDYNSEYIGVMPYTSPVGSFAANGYGLYDMTGNVWERCWDLFSSSGYESGTNPRGPAVASTGRVKRGGSWSENASFGRCAWRNINHPALFNNSHGFRPAVGWTEGSNASVSLSGGISTIIIFSSQPQSLSVIQNQPASLSVTATGAGTLSYEWEKDGVVIPGATTSTLAFQAVKPWNVGSYRVRITDSVGTVVSEAAQLTLNTAQPASLWQDLLLFLPFAGNTTDLSPSARTVTQSNVTSGVSPLGTVAGSASFNGTSSRMDFSPNLPDLTEMSLSLWLRPRTTNHYAHLFSDWDDALGKDVYLIYDNGRIHIRSKATLLWTSDSFMTASNWYHITWVMGAAASKLYVNGQLFATVNQAGSNVGYKLRSNVGYFNYGSGGDFFSGELSAMRIYGRALTESEAVQLYQSDAPMPEIELEQPSGTALVDGSATTTWQALPTGGAAVAAPYVIRNVGVANLLNLGLTKSGTHAADFLLGSLSTTTLAPGESTAFTVTFAPGAGASGTRTATLQVASNDPDENPFDIALSGTAYSTTLDADSDGMNDWGEVKLSALGFDWQTPNTALVSTYYENASAAGLYNQTLYNANRTAGQSDVINSPNAYSLYTLSQVQNLNVGVPLLQR